MRITKAFGKNFQSYQDVEFDYSDLGLALIAGPTKAGKSTLLDLPCWVLFGTTSKEGAADDVKSWFAEGEATTGTVSVELADGSCLSVTRIRGKRSADNDLYYFIYRDMEHGSSDPTRGKDAPDTQRMIEELLGVDAELYISGSYLHQFSKADTFFVAKAKDRRDTVEKIADLSLPILLAEKASEARKSAKKARDSAAELQAKLDGKVEAGISQVEQTERSIQTWDTNRANRIAQLEQSIGDWSDEHAERCIKADEAIKEWEDDKANRIAGVEEGITAWEGRREERIALAQDKIDGFEIDRRNRALKIAGQLDLLDKSIVDPVEFDKRSDALKRQVKQMDTLNNDLRDLRIELSETKSRIKSLTGEYQRLVALGDVCPTCLGPCDNGNKQARCNEIEAELGTLVDTQDTQVERVAKLEEALSAKAKLDQSYQDLIQKRNDNQRLIDKRESERAKVAVIRAEPNPFLDRVELAKAEANPYTATLAALVREANPMKAEHASILSETNPYLYKLATVQAETNPFLAQLDANRSALQRAVEEKDLANGEVMLLDAKVSALTWLYDKSFVLRGEMLEQSVRQLQDRTNGYLERFFDAALRVKFDIKDGDKLEAGILNNSYPCPYKQLSGGERCMLKLTFSIAYMIAAQNKAGVKINTLIFDEALNGLDASLKVKAFTLLQSLEQEHESIILIDHNEEFKQLFAKQFSVSMAGAYSQIEQVDLEA